MQSQIKSLDFERQRRDASVPDSNAGPFAFVEVQEAMLAVDAQLERITRELRRICRVAVTPSSTSGDDVAKSLVDTIIRARSRRTEILPARLFADPAWDMLLELYRAQLGHYRVSIAGLTIASQVPPTTALRWIAILEGESLVGRTPDPLDRRRLFMRLTAAGSKAMEHYFSIPRAANAAGLSIR
jgi:DNA-binding MarR family transcriptional regulator